MKNNVYKLLRYIRIYGFTRALIKVLGRTRPLINLMPFFSLFLFRKGSGSVGVVGAGQHAYSSIGFYLSRFTRAKFLFVIDPDLAASRSFAVAYNAKNALGSYQLNKCGTNIPDIVYIASNHASHSDYAIQFINYGCDVFIEKPIAITFDQLNKLSSSARNFSGHIYSGYNRPFSPAVTKIRSEIKAEYPISLSCAVIGHYIPNDHWYRDPQEGTRVLANMGHWIDLAVHLLFSRGSFPEYLEIFYNVSDSSQPSDNVSISLISSQHDLISIFFTSRSEPFEGVSESIVFQQASVIAKINDFRSMEIWREESYEKIIYKPKDNGHRECVLQPYNKLLSRPWNELELSTRLILSIEEMALNSISRKRIYFNEASTSVA